MPSTFEVVAEPTRRRVLDVLRLGERSVGELVEALGLSQPTVSKHLRVLREAGLVTVRAQRRCYGCGPSRWSSLTRGWRPTGGCGHIAWTRWSGTSMTRKHSKKEWNDMATNDAPVAADGVLDEQDEKCVLRFERRLGHAIERVWAALTEPDHLMGWWGEAELELTVGGRFVIRWLNTDEAGQRFTMHATITRLEPPHLLETSGDAHGVLRWELRSDDAGGTVLSFSSTVELPEEFRTQTLAGWHYHLDALVDNLAGRPVELTDLPNQRWYQIRAGYTGQPN